MLHRMHALRRAARPLRMHCAPRPLPAGAAGFSTSRDKDDKEDTKQDDDESWKFTHVSSDGSSPHMVDVGVKRITRRSATARCTIRLPPAVLDELRHVGEQRLGAKTRGSELLMGPKGPIANTAVIAGVLGAKQTSTLIPFCHPLPLEDCQVRLHVVGDDAIEVECQVRVTHKTGVEMEALTGASVAALCVYDMCKALSHEIVIENTRLVEKTGGKRDFSAN